MKDKTDILFEAIEEPERFSEEEVMRLLEDPEVRALYHAMTKTADAMAASAEPDIDKEWEHFVSRNRPTHISGFSHSLRTFLKRNAAAVVTGAIATLAVVGATIGVNYSIKNRNISVQQQGVSEAVTEDAGKYQGTVRDSVGNLLPQTSTREAVVFKNETFGEIISVIAAHYNASIVFKTDSSKGLRLYFQWDPNLPLNEIVEQLDNFEQINIKLEENLLTVD